MYSRNYDRDVESFGPTGGKFMLDCAASCQKDARQKNVDV